MTTETTGLLYVSSKRAQLTEWEKHNLFDDNKSELDTNYLK